MVLIPITMSLIRPSFYYVNTFGHSISINNSAIPIQGKEMWGAEVDLSRAVVRPCLYLYGEISCWRNWRIGVSPFKNNMESESREAGNVMGLYLAFHIY